MASFKLKLIKFILLFGCSYQIIDLTRTYLNYEMTNNYLAVNIASTIQMTLCAQDFRYLAKNLNCYYGFLNRVTNEMSLKTCQDITTFTIRYKNDKICITMMDIENQTSNDKLGTISYMIFYPKEVDAIIHLPNEPSHFGKTFQLKFHGDNIIQYELKVNMFLTTILQYPYRTDCYDYNQANSKYQGSPIGGGVGGYYPPYPPP